MAPKLRVQVPLLTGIFFINMRFNFITIYSDTVVPIFSSSPVSPRSLVCLRGMQDSIVTAESLSAFGPISSSFSSEDFSSFSKFFKMRNSYLTSYSTKKSTQFGDYSNLSAYHSSQSGFIFEKNAVLVRIIKNSRYNSLIFRANGFRLGSLPLSTLVGRRNKFFCFFRGFSFYNLFVGLSSSIFMNRSCFWSISLDFIAFLKSSFFKYFVGLDSVGRAKRSFYRSQRQKVNFLKQAFLHFFFFQKNLMCSHIFFGRGVSTINFSAFYLSEAIFFNSRLGFNRKGTRRYLPLVLC